MATSTDDAKVKILTISLDELRKFYAHFSNTYDQLRIKALTMMAAEVAIVSFLFSDQNAAAIPTDADRRFFYFAGIIFLGVAFAFMLWTISSLKWMIPHDLYPSEAIYKKYKTEIKFLEYIHDDYIECINLCLPSVDKRAKRFNWTIYLLASGVIILMVLKLGGK